MRQVRRIAGDREALRAVRDIENMLYLSSTWLTKAHELIHDLESAAKSDLRQDEVYVVETPRGFTESFDLRVIETLESLGLIRHVRDGYAMKDGAGRGVGPLHRYYSGEGSLP